MLYETLGAYHSTNVHGELSYTYKFCICCLYVLQAPFVNFDVFRIRKKLIANCMWQISQLQNVLNYLYDTTLNRIIISQSIEVYVYAPEIDASESSVFAIEIDAGESIVLASNIDDTTINSSLVTIHVPNSLYIDTAQISLLISEVEQIRLLGVLYRIVSSNPLLYYDNFASWVAGTAFVTHPTGWIAEFSKLDATTFGRDANCNIENLMLGCKMVLNPDVHPDGYVQIDTYNSIPKGLLLPNTTYKLTLTFTVSSNKASLTIQWFKESGFSVNESKSVSGTYEYTMLTILATGTTGRIVLTLNRNFSNWTSGDGEVWADIQLVSIEAVI